MSTGSVASAHRGLGFLFLGVTIVMFFLAGLGAFDPGGVGFDPHAATGSALTVVALILLVLAAIGRREALQASAWLFGLMIVQNILGAVGEDVPVLGGLHPVNGLLIMFAAHQAARGLPLPFGGRATTTRAPAS